MAPTPTPEGHEMHHESDGPLLRVSGLVKEFPGVRALDGVDLEVRPGEVHCLLGQNGAGKSTLIKVLSGAHQPDAGTIEWQGRTVRLPSPVSATRLGIATMYQELDLVPGLSVSENVYLGHEPSAAGFINRGLQARRTTDLLTRLGHQDIPAHREVGRLSAAGRQIVSMARALSHRARLIIMDEPSAVLDGDEVFTLFRVVRDLTAEGVAVLYISHRLEEIRSIGDRVTVLKDGRTVARDLPAESTPTDELIRLITGRAGQGGFPVRRVPAPDPASDTAPALEVRGLTRFAEFTDVDLTVRPGEILGLAGLVGSGRSEILETVFGARRADLGEVRIGGRRVRPGSVPAAVRAGLGLCPEERKSQALVLPQSVAGNITLASLREFSRMGFVRHGDETKAADRLVEDLDVRPRDASRPVGTLSGGNQQKAVLARWLLRDCKVLLLDEPTRGVDVGARTELYEVVRGLADAGVAIVVVSSEVPEVLGLADRVAVVREGRIVRVADAADISESDVLDLVMSHHRSHAEEGAA